MISEDLRLLGLQNISKGWRAVFWLVGGPIASGLVCYICLLLFFAIGGPDIDKKGSATEEFIARNFSVFILLLLISGILYSLIRAILCLLHKNENGA
ncbi:hypothetical protein RAHE111665_17710 [Rariglobus hedericola]